MRGVLSNVAFLLGGKGVNAALSLVYLALATRTLGLEGFGTLALVVALGQAVSGFSTFQTWQLVVRWGVNSKTADNAVGFAIALDLASVVAGAVIAAVVVLAGGSLLPLNGPERLVALGYCLVTLLTIRSTPIGMLRLHDRYAWSAAADSVTPVVRCVGAVLAALISPTLTGFLVAWAAAELATAAAYWTCAARCQRIPLDAVSLRRLPMKDAGIWSFAWNTNLTASVSTGSRQVLLLLIGALGGAAMAGTYRVASQLGQALVKIAQSLLRAIYPELIRSPSAARSLVFGLSRLAAVAAVGAVVLAIIIGPRLIDFVAGEQFAGAYPPMILLALAGGIELTGASFEAWLVAQGLTGRVLLLRAIPTITSLIALAFAVAHLQATGAAVTVLAASSATALGYIWAAGVAKLRQARAPASQLGCNR